MQITGYRSLRTYRDWGRPVGDVNGFVGSGLTEVAVVIIETDSGVEGIGIGSDSDIERLFPALLGQDPRSVSTLYDGMLAQVFKAGHAGATFGGIGTLDAALWDLKAKDADEPLWRMLGAADRFVPGYASGLDIALDDDQLARFYGELADRGFTSGKLKGGRNVQDDLRRLGIIADALAVNSPQPALMLDANESWNLKQAVRYMRNIEDRVDLTWIEEPLRRWDADGHARLTRSIKSAVATGENLTGLEQYRPMLAAGAVDIVQTAAIWGISHFLRVAHAAHFHDLPISPVGLTANPSVTHAAVAVPNHLTAEVQDLGDPYGVVTNLEYESGGILLGSTPGAGITVNEAEIMRATTAGDWLIAEGPHVRPPRAGLHMAPKRAPSESTA